MSEKDKHKAGDILVKENSDGDQFPVGMRVLAIDANSVCLRYLVALLEICRYKVRATTKAEEALRMLRENKDEFDIVITDFVRQDIDGFKLLQIIGIEMDIPVIMVSANDDLANISKSVTNGARDYLLKPLRLQEMRNIWQHVYRKKVSNPDQSCITKDITDRKSLPTKTVNVKLKREEDETTHTDQSQSLFSVRKKMRFTWTSDLHLKFVNAIQELGDGDAVPNKILRTMNVPGLTRENVASHLQKYRNILKKQSAAVIEKELHGEPADSNISSGNSNSNKSYGTAYRAMREELVPAGDFFDHLGNIISRSEALDRSPINICPTDIKERNLKPRDHQLEMFQYYMHSPGHSIGQIQQGRIHSHHVYENLPPTPLPTKTYHLPVLADHFNFPNIFPGIKLHDGSMGISSQPFSYRIGSQGDAGSTRPPSSSSLLDHEALYSIVDQAAGASSTRLYPNRPADDSYSPPSQMLVDASIHMGSTSHQHASVPRPLQNFVLDCPDYMQYAAMSDLKGKGKAANAFQYFPEHGNAESGSHHYSSGFTDDDLAAIVEEFTRDDAPKSCDHDRLLTEAEARNFQNPT